MKKTREYRVVKIKRRVLQKEGGEMTIECDSKYVIDLDRVLTNTYLVAEACLEQVEKTIINEGVEKRV